MEISRNALAGNATAQGYCYGFGKFEYGETACRLLDV